MRTLAFRTLAVLVCAAPTVARAQNPAPQKPDSAGTLKATIDSINGVAKARAGFDSSAQTLDRVLVTAKRRAYSVRNSSTAMKTDTPLRDTPQSVTVVTRALIADQGMQSMSDVVRYVPGISMAQGEGHRDAPVIRGNSSTADFFVDGVRDDVQYLRDLYNAERIEALKGPNAMIFGRGGGGGVINRVTKEAGWLPVRTFTAEGGSHDHRRASLDVDQGLGTAFAARLNGMYENSGLFRDATTLERFGINPTATLIAGPHSVARIGYELFDDKRVVDRGVPSFDGRPVQTNVHTFFGDPDVSHAHARVHAAALSAEHIAPSGLTIRNKTRFAHYDKFYQNVYPGGTSADGESVNLSAYNNATRRANLFNQTDVVYAATTGTVRQTLLLGAEVGRQASDNFRATGYFNGSATSYAVPLSAPTVAVPVSFRQSATDADNHVAVLVGALYAQNQIELTSHWQAIAGLRYDRFDLRYRNNRNDQRLRRTDRMLSPRLGLVFKPVEPLSFYSSYGVSHLPSSGDQFSSLNTTTSTLEPEKFRNYEIGAKWDVAGFTVAAAAYRLDRTNTSAKDPNDPERTVQTGAQRTSGYELGVTGSLSDVWQVSGGWTQQRAVITSTTTAALAGATVPLVPHHTLSLWNRYQALPALGVGLGVVHQARVYAAIDNSVTLPGFTRADAALFLSLGRFVRAQANIENLFDRRYFATAQGNNNIMPGASRTVRVSLMTGF